jgi:hypothetical protein
MTILQDANVGDFIATATIERPGWATAVGRLRAAYERANGPINRSVFLAELGRAGCTLVGVGSTVLVVGRYLPPEAAEPE